MCEYCSRGLEAYCPDNPLNWRCEWRGESTCSGRGASGGGFRGEGDEAHPNGSTRPLRPRTGRSRLLLPLRGGGLHLKRG